MKADDPYWTKKLAKRDTLPTAEEITKAVSYGFTKYGDNPEAVIAAAVELADAHDDAVRAYATATEYVDERVTEEDQRWPGWEQYAGPDVQAVLAARWRWFDGPHAPRVPSFGIFLGGGTSRRGKPERYAVSVWAKWAASYRKAARELMKAVGDQLAAV